MEWVVLTDEGGAAVPILDAAPIADTGQPALPVRVISSLAAGGPGGGLTDAELRASAVAVDVSDRAARVVGLVDMADDPLRILGLVAGPLTDAQLRAAAVPVSGPLTDAQLRAAAVKAREDTGPMTWVSAVGTASAANAVLVDTGALAAGAYDFDVQLGAGGILTAGVVLILEHRNAANGATLFNLAMVGSASTLAVRLRRYTIAVNERLRVIVGAVAFPAASRSQAAIGRRIS